MDTVEKSAVEKLENRLANRYSIKQGSVDLVPCKMWLSSRVRYYSRVATFYKVPEQNGQVRLVRFYLVKWS